MDETQEPSSGRTEGVQRDPAPTLPPAQITDILDHLSDPIYAVDDEWRITYLNIRAEPSGTGLVVSFSEITARKHAEERLAYHALLLENIHDAVVAADERLVVTAWNRAAEQLYGWTEEEVLGRDIRDVVRSDFDSEQRAAGYRVLAETGYFRAEAVHYRKDGTPIHIEGIIVALRDAAERVTGYVYVYRDITERKRAEEASRASEERFRSYFELGLIGMAITSPTKGILEVNDEFCAILGYERSELLQKTWVQMTHPDDLAVDLAKFNQVMDGEIDGYSLDKRWIRKDGQVIDSTISVKCLRRADGTAEYFVALLQDITERKRAEEVLHRAHDELEAKVAERTRELAERNEHLHAEIAERKRTEEALKVSNRQIEDILESITDAFVAFDREWRYTYINERALDRARKATGAELAREDVLGENCWELLPDTVGTLYDREFHTAFREQKTVHFETYYAPIDRWLEVHAYPSENGLSAFSQDITARKRAEAPLAYHAHLLENIHDAVTATDERFVVTAWNKGAEEMFGWTADEALGRKVYELIPTDYSDEQLAEALRELSETGRRRSEGLRYRKDGTPIYAEALTIPLRGEQGQVTGYLGIHRDITERKRAEGLLREANERLKMILDSITDRFFAFDSQWRYTHFNKRAEEQLRAFGKDPASLIGKTLWEEFPNPPAEESFRRAMRDRAMIIHEHDYPPLGEWVENRIFPSPDGGLAIFVRYITERKQAEQARQHLLEQLVSAQEEERRRLARELHDSLGQQLTALHLGLKAVQERDDCSAGVVNRLQQLRELALTLDEELDRIAFELRPPVLDGLGLADALRLLVREWSATSHIPVDMHLSGLDQGRFAATLETTLYRIVQAALTNILKYADATRVSLIVERRNGEVQAIIEDDGRGFDRAAVMQASSARRQLGLRGMEERAALAGGHLNIETAVGAGTTIYVHIPLPAAADERGSASDS